MQKRGSSTIIVTLILIVLSLVAVGAVWLVVSNLIKGQSEQIVLDKLNFNGEITGLTLDNSNNDIGISIKIDVGQANLKGMKFYFYNETGTEVITQYFTLEELGQKKFNFILRMNLSNVKDSKVCP